MRSYFWIPIIGSLQQAFLLNLANLLDVKRTDVLSINILLDKVFDKEENEERDEKIDEEKKQEKQNIKNWFNKEDITKIINNILKRRNKNAWHKDVKFTLGDRSLEKEYYLGDREINKILNLLIKILETVRWDANMNGSSYILQFKELKKYCEQHTKFVLENWLNTEAYKKLQNIQENPE